MSGHDIVPQTPAVYFIGNVDVRAVVGRSGDHDLKWLESVPLRDLLLTLPRTLSTYRRITPGLTPRGASC